MKQNKISIVTPSFNQGQFLEETILSVLDQNYPNLEYMIIDGGSTDNSIDIIKKYEKYLTFWVSEKDNGQTHAINKGFNRATGDLVNWINSDDLLEDGILKILGETLLEHPEADFIYGDYRAIDQYSKTIYQRKSAPYCKKCLYWGRQVSSQPAVFFKRSMLEKNGMLDEQFNFCMDIEFWVRCAMNDAKFHQLRKSLGVTRVHGDAKTTNLQKLLHDEHKSLVRSYGSMNLFSEGSPTEKFVYKLSNRYWRYFSAFNRLIYRGDFSLGNASKALKDIK